MTPTKDEVFVGIANSQTQKKRELVENAMQLNPSQVVIEVSGGCGTSERG
jgi:hypothetical protein